MRARPNCVRDDELLERLGAVLSDIDPVPCSVIARARATFGSRAALSASRRRGEAMIAAGQVGLAELLGPAGELRLLTARAGADVPGVAARRPDRVV